MTPPKHPTVCNICGGKVSYVSNARVYGSRYGSGWCYLCESCGAYVGTHGPRPREALGILADKRMRRLKMECHELFENDRNILMTMIGKFAGGPGGLDTLAAAIGEDAGTIEDVYEPYLVKNGLINRTPKGRVVTELAYQHLGIEHSV